MTVLTISFGVFAIRRCSSSSQNSPFHEYHDLTGTMLTQATRCRSIRDRAISADFAGGTVVRITQISEGFFVSPFFSMPLMLSVRDNKHTSSHTL